MSGFDGIEQFDGAKCAPSDGTQEGYPGIAHDFERTKQKCDAPNAEHVNLRKQFYALAGAVGWSHERCAQTGDSPLDCAHELRAQLTAAQDQLAHEIAMHSLTSDVLARERQAKAGLLASHVRVEDLLSDAEKRVRELEAQVLLDTGNIERIRAAGARAETTLAEAQRENKLLREQLAAMVEQPDYSSGPIDEHCSVTPAPPSIAAAVALAVERCSLVCRALRYSATVLDGRKMIAYTDECEHNVRALATTITAEAEAMIEDAERWREIVKQFVHERCGPNVGWTLGNLVLQGDSPEEAVDKARGKP